MSSSQPPQPPAGGPPPGPGQPPQGQPPYGQPAYGQPPQAPPPGYGPPPGYAPSPGYGPPPTAPNPYGQPAGSGFSFDLKKLKMADYVIVAGTVLYLILALFPWFTFGDEFFGFSLSGFDSGNVSTAFVLFLLATAWAVLPAFVDLKLGFPRSWVTVGLAAVGWLLTLFAWIDSFKGDFSIFALLGFLDATAILLFAVLSLLPELRNRPALPGGLATAAQWANQPAPEFGHQGQPGRPGPGYGPPPATGTYGQPSAPPQYAPPPAPPGPGPVPPPPPSGGPGADRPSGLL